MIFKKCSFTEFSISNDAGNGLLRKRLSRIQRRNEMKPVAHSSFVDKRNQGKCKKFPHFSKRK